MGLGCGAYRRVPSRALILTVLLGGCLIDGAMGATPGAGMRDCLPLPFETNEGQAGPDVQFLARGRGYSVALTRTGMELSTAESGPTGSHGLLRLEFRGANPSPELIGLDMLPGRVSYFHGNDPGHWLSGISSCATVRYADLYPGIDLVFHGNGSNLEYDFVLAPGAEPARIAVAVQGAEIELAASGDLVLKAWGRELVMRCPLVFEESDGHRRELPGSFVLLGQDRIGFEVSGRSPSKRLVIDPVIVYSTYVGGEGSTVTKGIGVDRRGNVYLAGETTVEGGFDVFVTKIDPLGSQVLYTSYFGGSEFDFATAFAVSRDGSVHVAGWTRSPDFPVVSAFQPDFVGAPGDFPADAFVTKLSPDGSTLEFSTFLGGSGHEEASGIAVDAAGCSYVVGTTASLDFPTRHALKADSDGEDAFLTKLNRRGTALVYSTYLGGSGSDLAGGVAVSPGGAAYVTGFTASADFPTTPRAFQRGIQGSSDAFVLKLKANGRSFAYSTYLGGSSGDAGSGIAVDGSGCAYLTGQTTSTDFPLAHATQSAIGGALLDQIETDAFLVKLDKKGAALVFSTYLGGSNIEEGFGVACSGSRHVLVTGLTQSRDLPTVDPWQPDSGGAIDAFVARYDVKLHTLVYSSYLGGGNIDLGWGVAFDPEGRACVAGSTISDDFPLVNAFQTSLAGSGDSFVTKIGE